jgi:hypothetical protein
MPTSTYTPIATYTVSGTAHDIIFSSIPQTYTDLRIVISARGTASVSVEDIYFYFGTYASDESFTYLQGTGSSVSSGRVSNVNQTTIGSCPSGTSTAGLISTTTVDLFNYSNTTTYKTFISRGSDTNNVSYASVGLKRSTSAISQIVIFPSTSTYWAAGSTFTLYGIKAA